MLWSCPHASAFCKPCTLTHMRSTMEHRFPCMAVCIRLCQHVPTTHIAALPRLQCITKPPAGACDWVLMQNLGRVQYLGGRMR